MQFLSRAAVLLAAAALQTAQPQPPTRQPSAWLLAHAQVLPPGATPLPDENGSFILAAAHPAALQTRYQPGIPHGVIVTFTMSSLQSREYPGIARTPGTFGAPDPSDPRRLTVTTSHPQPWTRTVTVYVPRQYVPGSVAPLLVGADGPDPLLFTTLDALIAAHRVPAMVAVSVQNGGGDAQGSERGLEYDTMSGAYAEFVEHEVLPLVEQNAHVRLTRNPDGRAAMGGSSGAAAAFIMAWYHPELYHRVISYSGTFVNQQWPWNPRTPGGAAGFWQAFHVLPSLIAGLPRGPLRAWLEVGDRDLLQPNVMRDGLHDWVQANEAMAQALAAKGYAYQLVFARNAGHVDQAVKSQTLPEALEYAWRGYAAAR